MAKRKKYSAAKCPDPINFMFDLAGALAMGAYAKHQIKKDYQRGQGETSAKAALMVYGSGAMRTGSSGLMSLGGLLGVNSALRDIERKEAAARRNAALIRRSDHTPAYNDEVYIPPYKTNDNRYAWRLNCEDGSAYGVSPSEYETREDYNRALQNAKGDQVETPQKAVAHSEPEQESPFQGSNYLCCRVSRLDNGANEFYLTDDETIKVGDRITVSTEAGTSEGIVIGVRKLSEMTTDELPKDNMWVLSQEEEEISSPEND